MKEKYKHKWISHPDLGLRGAVMSSICERCRINEEDNAADYPCDDKTLLLLREVEDLQLELEEAEDRLRNHVKTLEKK